MSNEQPTEPGWWWWEGHRKPVEVDGLGGAWDGVVCLGFVESLSGRWHRIQPPWEEGK